MGVGGDEFDLAAAYGRYAKDLTRFATGLVGPSEAPDAVSGAIVRCLESAALKDVQDERAYLFRAVYNEARMGHRASLRRTAREMRAASPPVVAEPVIQPEVFNAVVRLSIRQRAVIVLTYWADLRPAEVAEYLGITEGAVRRHLARARRRLRESLHE